MKLVNLKIKTFITKKHVILMGFIYIGDKIIEADRKKIKLLINEKQYDVFFPFKRFINFKQ